MRQLVDLDSETRLRCLLVTAFHSTLGSSRSRRTRSLRVGTLLSPAFHVQKTQGNKNALITPLFTYMTIPNRTITALQQTKTVHTHQRTPSMPLSQSFLSLRRTLCSSILSNTVNLRTHFVHGPILDSPPTFCQLALLINTLHRTLDLLHPSISVNRFQTRV